MQLAVYLFVFDMGDIMARIGAETTMNQHSGKVVDTT